MSDKMTPDQLNQAYLEYLVVESLYQHSKQSDGNFGYYSRIHDQARVNAIKALAGSGTGLEPIASDFCDDVAKPITDF